MFVALPLAVLWCVCVCRRRMHPFASLPSLMCALQLTHTTDTPAFPTLIIILISSLLRHCHHRQELNHLIGRLLNYLLRVPTLILHFRSGLSISLHRRLCFGYQRELHCRDKQLQHSPGQHIRRHQPNISLHRRRHSFSLQSCTR
jgi:hypothetical protein